MIKRWFISEKMPIHRPALPLSCRRFWIKRRFFAPPALDPRTATRLRSPGVLWNAAPPSWLWRWKSFRLALPEKHRGCRLAGL